MRTCLLAAASAATTLIAAAALAQDPEPSGEPSEETPDEVAPPKKVAPLEKRAPADAVATPPSPPVGPASGFMLQARMAAQPNLVSSFVASPAFIAGYRWDRLTLGVGLGLTFASGGTDETSISTSAFQLVPTLFYDVWHSKDLRARFNFVGGLGFGRGGATVARQKRVIDPDTGEDVGTETDEQNVSATLIPLIVGAGGDYFVHPNFALGADAGFQGLFVAGVSSDEDLDIDGASLGSQGLYAAIRATVIVGN